MSEQDEHPLVDESPFGLSAFANVMDTLAGGEDSEAAGAEAAEDAATPTAGDSSYSSDATSGDGSDDSRSGPVDGAEAGGADGATGGDSEQLATTSPPGDIPASWTIDSKAIESELGSLSTSLEERTMEAFQQAAYTEAREEYENYFEALEKHPRLLVGTEVPAIGAEGTEVLRDTNDAREWQEAVKSILVQEIQERANNQMEENRSTLDTLHASIDLFKRNPDLIPGTATFNRRLADSFAKLVSPYEVRVEGVLQGYSIPVQPIIDSLRNEIGRVQKPSTAPTSAPAVSKKKADPPQAGISSKAGTTSEQSDFSTLFGTIGLPDLQI